MSDIRSAVVAGRFYPNDPAELRDLIVGMLGQAGGEPGPALAAVVPHAGLVYSGGCAAQVFKRVEIPNTVVLLAPNHTGYWERAGGASAWSQGSYGTPLGEHSIAVDFLAQLEQESRLVAHDPVAHLGEHAIEVELPFVTVLAADAEVAPIVLGWDDWDRCKELATALARVIRQWAGNVLLVASSDMTHYESAQSAARKDELALACVERLDGSDLLATCAREHITMCGRAPTATVIEAARQLGGVEAEVVDYRHSGWVTGDDSSVVAYAGVVVR